MSFQSNPATKAVAVTPSDTTDLTAALGGPVRALYVAGTGNLVVVMAGDTGTDTSITFTDVLGGVIYPLAVKKVMAATSATGVVALG